MSITQGYRGGLDAITGLATQIRLPAMPGSTSSMPKNYGFPQPAANNAYQYLYYEGLQVPVLNASMLVTEDWFSATNLNAWFMTRTNDDLAEVGLGFRFWDGYSGVTMAGAKGNTFSLGSVQGQPISASCMFMGTDLTAIVGTPSFTVITSNPLTWSRVTIAGITQVASWQLMWTNNCTPNPEHNASVHPSEINAGPPAASLRVTLAAEAAQPVDGSDITITIAKPVAATSLVITCRNPKVLAPNERAIQPARAFRQYDMNLLGDVDGTPAEVCPLLIAEA